jgi:hypothetical protein
MGALALTACPRQGAVWIEGQAAPGRPVFGVGRTLRGPATWLGYFIVAPCDSFDGSAGTARWQLVQNGEPRAISRLTYGQVPDGYVATRALSTERPRTAVADPLGPGCYVAVMSGSGRVEFTVAADGSVLEVEHER